jgi:hypothetical protein
MAKKAAKKAVAKGGSKQPPKPPPPPPIQISRSLLGYLTQFYVVSQIKKAISRYRTTVKLATPKGDLITEENLGSMGRDGGVDAVILYDTKNDAELRKTHNGIREKLLSIFGRSDG